GNLPAAAELLASLHPGPDTDSYLFLAQIEQWIYERRYADAIVALKTAVAKPDADRRRRVGNMQRLARLQEHAGDSSAAHATWQEVRSEAEDLRRIKGEDSFYLTVALTLASAYIGLGDESKAFAILKEVAATPRFSRDAWWRGYSTVQM